MNVSQSKLTESQSTIGDESLIGLSAQLKGLSEDENNSHGDKPTKPSTINQATGGNFLWLHKEGKKIENASGTGYLCDDDDGRDEEFQNV